MAQDIAAAVRADVERLQEYDLSPVDTYLAAYGPALQVISENWGTRRETANPDRPSDPFAITPMDALAVARDEVIAFRTAQLSNGSRQTLTDPLTWFYILAQDGAGSAIMPFDEANLFARALGVELAGNEAKRVLENKSRTCNTQVRHRANGGTHHIRVPSCNDRRWTKPTPPSPSPPGRTRRQPSTGWTSTGTGGRRGNCEPPSRPCAESASPATPTTPPLGPSMPCCTTRRRRRPTQGALLGTVDSGE